MVVYPKFEAFVKIPFRLADISSTLKYLCVYPLNATTDESETPEWPRKLQRQKCDRNSCLDVTKNLSQKWTK